MSKFVIKTIQLRDTWENDAWSLSLSGMEFYVLKIKHNKYCKLEPMIGINAS